MGDSASSATSCSSDGTSGKMSPSDGRGHGSAPSEGSMEMPPSRGVVEMDFAVGSHEIVKIPTAGRIMPRYL